MSYYDKVFKENIRTILAQPTIPSTRAVWEDTNEPANTKKSFGIINRYDLRKEIPVGTLRKFPIRNCIDELLWIWQKKSNNIKDLRSHIWDSWADSNGSIGAAYGFQVASKLRPVRTETKGVDSGATIITVTTDYLDQTDYVIHELKHNPFSRRIITDLYSVDQTNIMGLDPCAYSMTYNVTLDESGNKVLNGILNQRSQDMIVANNWNIFQYSVLLILFAKEANMIPGEIIHVIADAHIYDRHIPIAEELLEREEYDAPKLSINESKKSFYKYNCDDFTLMHYKHGDAINNIPVAV